MNQPPLNYIGDPSRQYVVTIPDYNIDAPNARLYTYSRVFFCASYYYKNVSVIIDHQKIAQNIPNLHIKIANENNSIAAFFMVNDSIFMMIDTDWPLYKWTTWIPHYADRCSAFFVSSLRTSTQFIFDNCTIPVYPLPHPCGPGLSGTSEAMFEYYHSLRLEKMIPIFFHGRYRVRHSRKSIARMLRSNFPEAQIGFKENNPIDLEEYINLMSRAKIAWCPKSIKCDSGHECNTLTCKEMEAMCLETMILKTPTHVTEVEERIAGVHFVEIDNYSRDIVEKVSYYLVHDDERKEIAHNGRLYWERNLSPWARCNYMLTKCIEAMQK